MFLSEIPLPLHNRNTPKKSLQYISSFVAIACAGVLFSSGVKQKSDEGVPDFIDKKSSLSVSVEMRELINEIFAKTKDIEELQLRKSEKIQKISRIPLSDRGVYWTRLFRDLHLDSDMILDLIQRESKGLPSAISSKGAKGLMQIKDIVLDDMMGIGGVKKYGSFFLSLRTDTIEKMSYTEDKEKIAQLKKLIRNILLLAESKKRDSLKEYLDEYNQLIFSIKTELYNPDLNIIFGSIYIKYLERLSSEIPEDKLQTVAHVIENIDTDDIDRINQLRISDKKRKLSQDYDFMDLNTKKILILSMYNTGPNAKDIKPGILYAIAILA